MADAHYTPGDEMLASLSQEQIVQRWRDLREMLIQQLDRFENGGLTLHSDSADISPSAIAGLKERILEFDGLISKDASLAGAETAFPS